MSSKRIPGNTARGLYNRKTSFACARAPPPVRGAFVLPPAPHGRVDEAAAARDAVARRMGSRYSSPSLVSPRWKVDIEFFLTSLLRRFGGVKGSLAGGRAGAGLPMRQLVVEPQHLALLRKGTAQTS